MLTFFGMSSWGANATKPPVNLGKLGWIGVLLVAVLPWTGQAQFYFITNNGALTITAYFGSAGNVVIPVSQTATR